MTRSTRNGALVVAVLVAPFVRAAPPAARPAPASPVSALDSARALARSGDARARDRYAEAVRQHPAEAPLRAEFADYLWSTGSSAGAEEQMDWLLEHGRPKPGFLRFYGLRLFDAKNFVKAASVLERASREEPPDYDLLFCLGAARLEEGDFAGAETAFRAAISRSPENAGAHHLLGRLWNLVGRPAEAATELRAAADAEGSSADIWLDLAQALFASQHRAEAEEACRRAIALQSDRAAAHATLAAVLRAEGKREEAAAELAMSRSLYDREEERVQNERASVARAMQGWVLLAANRPKEALAQFESAPDSSSAWKGRAESLERLGRRTEAIHALERAKALAPEDRSLDYSLERLRRTPAKGSH